MIEASVLPKVKLDRNRTLKMTDFFKQIVTRVKEGLDNTPHKIDSDSQTLSVLRRSLKKLPYKFNPDSRGGSSEKVQAASTTPQPAPAILCGRKRKRMEISLINQKFIENYFGKTPKKSVHETPEVNSTSSKSKKIFSPHIKVR